MNMQDIADALGVSRVTVSCVLNNRIKERRIAKATVKKVRDYVEKTGFHQDLGALSMRGKYTKDIGIVTSHEIFPANRQLYFSLVEFLNSNDISFEAFYATGGNLGELVQQISFFGIKRLIIIASHFSFELQAKYLQQLHTQCKNVKDFYFHDVHKSFFEKFNPIADNITVSHVKRENRVKIIAEYLKAKGYRKIIGEKTVVNEYESCGFEIESGSFGIMPFRKKTAFKYQLTNLMLEYGKFLAEQYKDYPFKNTRCCFYSHDDWQAMSMLHNFQATGFSIPQDFGLVSWGNLPEVECLALTSFGLPHNEMFKHLCDWIDGKISKKGIETFQIIRNNGVTA